MSMEDTPALVALLILGKLQWIRNALNLTCCFLLVWRCFNPAAFLWRRGFQESNCSIVVSASHPKTSQCLSIPFNTTLVYAQYDRTASRNFFPPIVYLTLPCNLPYSDLRCCWSDRAKNYCRASRTCIQEPVVVFFFPL